LGNILLPSFTIPLEKYTYGIKKNICSIFGKIYLYRRPPPLLAEKMHALNYTYKDGRIGGFSSLGHYYCA
jgi:hypothetical protein